MDLATESRDAPGATRPETVPSLLAASAARTPSAAALLAPGRGSLDYQGLAAHVEELGRRLAGLGVAREDRVAVVLPNGPEAVTAFLAAHPQDEHGRHHYTFADTELDEGAWRERSRRYQEYFDVPSES